MKCLDLFGNRLVLWSVALWLPALLLVGVGSLDAHMPDGSVPTRTVAESPVPGVRIIREKNYDKQPANYLSANLYTTLADGRDTLNKFVAFDFQVTPGGGPLPHTHSNEWETFFVHQGEVEFTVGVGDAPPFPFLTQTTPAGTLVYGAQGPVHGFLNKSGAPARIFSFAMPAGLDNFFVTSGDPVIDFNAPIPPISLEEILRTAFWAEQRGDALHPPGVPGTPLGCLPPPTGPPPPGVPFPLPGYACPPVGHVVSSITDPPASGVGPFGETRVHLLTKEQAGNITGATAFCGPGVPGRPGGSVDYDYFSLPYRDGFPAMVTSPNIEVFYVLDGPLSFKFANGKTVNVRELTYIEIQAGVPFSIANPKNTLAGSLNIKVIPPPSCDGSFLPPPAPPALEIQRTPTGKMPGRESGEEIMERYRNRQR